MCIYECVQYLQMSRLVIPTTSTTGEAGAPAFGAYRDHTPGSTRCRRSTAQPLCGLCALCGCYGTAISAGSAVGREGGMEVTRDQLEPETVTLVCNY